MKHLKKFNEKYSRDEEGCWECPYCDNTFDDDKEGYSDLIEHVEKKHSKKESLDPSKGFITNFKEELDNIIYDIATPEAIENGDAYGVVRNISDWLETNLKNLLFDAMSASAEDKSLSYKDWIDEKLK